MMSLLLIRILYCFYWLW